MIYCPVCNLWGVSEDHSLRFHSDIGVGTQTKDMIWKAPCCPCRDPTKGIYIGDCFCHCHKQFESPTNPVRYWTGDPSQPYYRTTCEVMS